MDPHLHSLPLRRERGGYHDKEVEMHQEREIALSMRGHCLVQMTCDGSPMCAWLQEQSGSLQRVGKGP